MELLPDDGSAFYNRGLAKAKMADYENAIKDFDQAISLNSEYTSAYNNRGRAKANLNLNEDAIS